MPWALRKNKPSWKEKGCSVMGAAPGMNATNSHCHCLIFPSFSNIETFHIVGRLWLSSRALKWLLLPVLQMTWVPSHNPPSFLFIPLSVLLLQLYNLSLYSSTCTAELSTPLDPAYVVPSSWGLLPLIHAHWSLPSLNSYYTSLSHNHFLCAMILFSATSLSLWDKELGFHVSVSLPHTWYNGWVHGKFLPTSTQKCTLEEKCLVAHVVEPSP